MSTKDVANKWLAYCKTGQYEEAHKELYSPNCVSQEMEGVQGYPEKAVGMEEIKVKGEQWNQLIEAFYGTEIDGPIVAGNHFTATMKMDVKMKGRPRSVNEQVGVFRVEDGKIVHERFFYILGRPYMLTAQR